MSLVDKLAERVRNRALSTGGKVTPLTGNVQLVAPVTVPGNFLTSILDAQDSSPSKSRVGGDGLIHVSSLIGFCARQHAILQLHKDGQAILKPTHGGDRVMWAIGRSVEEHIRAQIIADRCKDVYGIWKCVCEKSAPHVGFWAQNMCPVCGGPKNTYHEHPLQDDDAGVIGNPDLLLRVGCHILVVEIKSMNKKDWDKIDAAKGDHLFQASWYVNILRRRGFEVHDTAHVVYACKDYVFGSPYKEFPFNACTPQLLAQIERARVVAKEAHAAIGSGVLPPRVVCEAYTAPFAKKCPCVVQCFNRE